MRILNLSYLAIPNLVGHETLHRSIDDVKGDWGRFISEVADFKPDIIWEREWNDNRALYEPLYKAFPKVKKAWHWIDQHVNLDYRMSYAENFDYIFMAISKFIPIAKQRLGHDRVFWLPLYWSHGPLVLNRDPKQYEISMVCRWTPEELFGARIRCINRLKSHFGSRFLAINSGDMINIVRRSQVSVNHSYSLETNFRHYEVLGCGTELITSDGEDLHKIPGLAERCTIYSDLDDLILKIEAVLSGQSIHPMDEVQRWIHEHHSIEVRHRTILDTVFGERKGYG